MSILLIISKITIGPTCLPLQNDQIQALHTGIGLGFQCQCTGNKWSRRESSVATFYRYLIHILLKSGWLRRRLLDLLYYPSVEVHKCFREVSSELTTHYIQSVQHLHHKD